MVTPSTAFSSSRSWPSKQAVEKRRRDIEVFSEVVETHQHFGVGAASADSAMGAAGLRGTHRTSQQAARVAPTVHDRFRTRDAAVLEHFGHRD